MKTLQLILIILIFSIYSQAQFAKLNLTHMRYGNENKFYSAQMLGVAGSGLAHRGSMALSITNPALIAPQKGKLNLLAGLMVDKLIEDRQFPYYDSFVGFNDFGSYSYNLNYYFAPYFQFNYQLPLKHFLAIQGGVIPFLDFRYHYAEEIRDPFDKTDKLLGYNWIKQKGLLNQFFLGFSTKALSNLSLGLKIGFLQGSIDSTMKIQPRTPGSLFTEQLQKRTRKLNNMPFLINIGAHYIINKRLAVGTFVQLPYQVEFKNHFQNDSITVKEKFTYPLQIGSGIDYRFQSILQARVFLDFIFNFSNKFTDSRIANLNYRQTFTLRGGTEFFFFHSQLPVRLGFAYNTLPYNHNLANTLLTVGTGWYLNHWHLDLAAGLNHQEFYQPDLFPDSIYGLQDRTDLDRVQWTNYFFRLDVTINLF